MYLGCTKFSVIIATIIIATQIWTREVDGGVKNQARVINGTEAKRGQFPWVVRLDVVKRTGSGSVAYTCTGSLISERFVLTASHCFLGDVEQIITYMGDVGARNETELNTIKSKRFHVHPCFKAGYARYDLGLIELERPYQLNENVQVIDLLVHAPNDKNTWDGKNVVIVGWGIKKVTYDDSAKKFIHHHTDHLLYANEWVIPRDKWASYGVAEEIGDWWLLRVMGNDTSMCSGDSGGPLLYSLGGSYKLIGIARSVPHDGLGNVCLQDIRHQTYIRTDVHLNWIVAVANNTPIGDINCHKYEPSSEEGASESLKNVSHDGKRPGPAKGKRIESTQNNTKAVDYFNYTLFLSCITLCLCLN